MREVTVLAFEALFSEAYEKCFGHRMTEPLTETESIAFSNEILNKTGLIVHAKNIRSYSSYLLDTPDSRDINPSAAILDTFVRYVVNAPHTNEEQRKDNEGHYPYWFSYKDRFYRTSYKKEQKSWLFPFAVLFAILILIAFIIIDFIS